MLRPGDSLILYTDGVIEASPLDHRFGPEQFARCVSECHGRAPVATARHIEDAVLGGAGRHGARRRRRAGPARVPAPGRAVCRGRAGGSGFDVKLLVLTPEPVDADLLRSVLGDEVEGAEVLVVSPATNQSKVAFWVSDSDDAIEEAEGAQEETVERLEEEGVDAAGDTGESEPAVAIQDALATFAADRIVVFSHPEGDRDYREDEGLADAEERFGVPAHARAHRALETDRSLRRYRRSVTRFFAAAAPFSGISQGVQALWTVRRMANSDLGHKALDMARLDL